MRTFWCSWGSFQNLLWSPFSLKNEHCGFAHSLISQVNCVMNALSLKMMILARICELWHWAHPERLSFSNWNEHILQSPALSCMGPEICFYFFFSNKLLSGSYAGGPQTSLSEIVEGLNLQSSALYICFLVWLSNDKVARCHHTMRQSYHRPWLHYLVHPFLQPAMKSFELP